MKINEKNQYNKIIKYNNNIVNKIKNINNVINEALNINILNLSNNIYFKGGVARTALEVLIYPNKNEYDNVRDYDLCYIGKYDDEYNKVRKYINDNYNNIDFDWEGDSIERYMNSRDISLNEVLLNNDEIIFTRRAYRDFKNKIINPKINYIEDRLASRLILFLGRYTNFKLSDEINFNEHYPFFYFLVALLKAYELGVEQNFFLLSKHYNLADANDYNNLHDWLIYLLNKIHNFNLYGRENLIAKDIIKGDYKKIILKYPEIKKEIDNLDIWIDNFYHYMRKKNRNKF